MHLLQYTIYLFNGIIIYYYYFDDDYNIIFHRFKLLFFFIPQKTTIRRILICHTIFVWYDIITFVLSSQAASHCVVGALCNSIFRVEKNSSHKLGRGGLQTKTRQRTTSRVLLYNNIHIIL